MFNKMKLSVLVAGLILSAGASAVEVKQEGNFLKGLEKWKNTCSRCHEMRDPKEFSDRQWKTVVTHMKIRAGLTGQDARDILAYFKNSN